MKTLDKLAECPLDVVGDIHGHYPALQKLLRELGYRDDGSHEEGRKLVFVGDLIDRGPDSPGVVRRVVQMIEAGNAQCVLGNHELNVLRDEPKPGNNWFFDVKTNPDDDGQSATPQERHSFREFFAELPLALQNDELRVVHACWHPASLERLEENSANAVSIVAEYERYEQEAWERLRNDGDFLLFEQEKEKYREFVSYHGKDPVEHWPDHKLLPGYAAVHEAMQMENPIAVLTSGEERKASATYPAGGRWRFVDRVRWWDEYQHDQSVIIGHYWRLFNERAIDKPDNARAGIFRGAGPGDWLGTRENVYCVDFSVAGRSKGYTSEACRLAALRLPEEIIVFDDGQTLPTNRGIR